MLHLKTARLARWQVRLLATSGFVLWVTGATWLLLHYYFQKQGDFGPETNPAEPWMMRLHGLALLGMLLGTGSLLVVHVWRGWGYRAHRVHGVAMLVTASVLILSGYLLYYASDELGRPIISIVHWVIGLASLPLFLWHYAAGKRVRVGR